MDRWAMILRSLRRTALAAAVLLPGSFAIAMPALAQLDTISQFYMPGRFCMWTAEGAGVWMCSGPPSGVAAKPRPPVFGSIAIAPNFNWWSSTKFGSEAEAKKAAIDGCNKANKGGCKTATVVVDYCAALATSPRDNIYRVKGSGAVNWAEESALAACSKAGGHACRISTSVCADGKRHVQTCETRFFNGNPVCVEPDGSDKPFGRGG
jgi:uncharacterized protein DUF4189